MLTYLTYPRIIGIQAPLSMYMNMIYETRSRVEYVNVTNKHLLAFQTIQNVYDVMSYSIHVTCSEAIRVKI